MIFVDFPYIRIPLQFIPSADAWCLRVPTTSNRPACWRRKTPSSSASKNEPGNGKPCCADSVRLTRYLRGKSKRNRSRWNGWISKTRFAVLWQLRGPSPTTGTGLTRTGGTCASWTCRKPSIIGGRQYLWTEKTPPLHTRFRS